MFSVITRFDHARVLVVDDSAFQRHLISTALKKAGFNHIETAEDGAGALEKTYNFCPDIVLLDLQMPNLDGFGYCERVRNDGNLPRMPIIVQTVLEDRESRLRALSCGADDYLIKPIDIEELSLRMCLHVERYFMLQDMHDMCGYLKMEIDEAAELLANAEKQGLASKSLSSHFEVLAQLLELPVVRF